MEEKELTKIACGVDISLVNKSFIWLPPRTGTTLALEVLKNFFFKSYHVTDGVVDFENPAKLHSHTPCLFQGHENFSFIITMRNPYSQAVSLYLMGKNNSEKFNFDEQKSNFQDFLIRKYHKAYLNPMYRRFERLPDYVIKTENIYEDYLKIPFIRESQYTKNGELKSIVDKKLNKNHVGLDWKLFYDKKTSDLVYYNNINFFEMFDYDKNSWKS